MKRASLLISLVALLSLGLAAPVLAAVPGNDTYATRVAITALPFSVSVDTTEATTDANDVEANLGCGAPATDASVWYEYVAGVDGGVLVDSSAADYTAGVMILTGAPGSFVVEGCGPGVAGFTAYAGTTYTILVFDDQSDGSGNGGNLELSVSAAPPAPVLDLSVDRSGSFNSKTGSATVRGTLTCSGAEFGKNAMDIQISQTVGRFTLTAAGSTDFICDGSAHPWSTELSTSAGRFSGGKASVSVFVSACGLFLCSNAEVDRVITLKK